ncbi:hypothetical protein ACQP00_05775 [Dactylosporangium sp. CS-047395]|uniref:hypothetical protein n=1 Tax=Dactylosporangium sp. CS-047395 TaxID=3239936 RepID=UPI003D8ADC65
MTFGRDKPMFDGAPGDPQVAPAPEERVSRPVGSAGARRSPKNRKSRIPAVTLDEVRARQRGATADIQAFDRFAETVRELRAANPEWGSKRLSAELRERGWANFRRAHVVLALTGRRPVVPERRDATPGPDIAPSKGPAHQPVPEPVAEQLRGITLASVPNTPPGHCPSCGVRVSAQGACRCS